jgi:hypothetical protein
MLLTKKAFVPLLLLLVFLSATRGEVVTRVVAWGDNSERQTLVPPTLANVTAIAAGDFHALALRNNGTVVGWGDNHSGQASPPEGLQNVKAIAAGGFHSLALRKDGSVVAWGRNDFGQCKVPRQVTVALAVAAGRNHSLALLHDGRVIAWGQNSTGQTDVPEELPPAQGVSAMGDWSSATLSAGRRADWGDLGQKPLRAPGSLPQGSTIAASPTHGIALLKDGGLLGWGYNESGQSSIPQGLKKARSIAVGKGFSMALIELESQEVHVDRIGPVLFHPKPIPFHAEASSHLPVTLSSSDPETVSCEDDKLIMHRAGLVTITAMQPGNNQFASASATTLVRVGLGLRTMRFFETIPTLYLGMHPKGVILRAGASAGDDPVVFTSSNPRVARIEGNILYTTGIGRARISAQVKQSPQYSFAPALYQFVEVAQPSDEQLLKAMFANRTFDGEANFKTIAGSTEKISYRYTVAFDGAIYGRATRTVWAPASAEAGDPKPAKNSEEKTKILIHGSVAPPFQYKIDEDGRILQGTGVHSLRFAKGLFSYGPVEYRSGDLRFQGLIKSMSKGYVLSGSCSCRSDAPPDATGQISESTRVGP